MILFRNINCIIADCTSSVLQNKEVKFCFQNFVKSTYSQKTLSSNVPVVSIGDVFDKTTLKSFNPKNEVVSSKGSIVIGGTYDHIHSGHKVLLSEATLLTDKKLVIGKCCSKLFCFFNLPFQWSACALIDKLKSGL